MNASSGSSRRRPVWLKPLFAVMALAAIALSVFNMEAGRAGLTERGFALDGTPVTVLQKRGADRAPAVVIAHGFAGSRQLMAPIANSLAQNGYVAVSFDFLGHGRNPQPLTGDVTKEEGATAALLAELRKVIAAARTMPESDGRVAVLGHSMASDIIVRAARADPEIAATVAISMFSREVTAEEPRNLLMVVGEWENFLAEEGFRMLSLPHGEDVEAGVTYGSHRDGTARRLVLADNVEHVGVLYSPDTLTASVEWLNAVFDRQSDGPLDVRGPWLVVLIGAVIALAWLLSALLPAVPRRAPAPEIARGRLVLACLGPALITPLILWPFDVELLPVLVAGYLAVHFLVYGALTMAAMAWLGQPIPRWPDRRLIVAAGLAGLYAVFALAIPLDLYFASFMPHAGRVPVILVLTLGALAYTLADEWLVRRPGAPRWLPFLSKLAVLVSLAIAVALNLADLFFLIIILPVIVLFFVIYGLMKGWAYRATGHPGVGAVAMGLAFGWALGVTFPLLAG